MEEYRRQLGSFGVSGDLALQTVASLSGGQKSRVAFARMCMACPNFLVLDEPTNHLDIETIEALGKAINKYTVSYLRSCLTIYNLVFYNLFLFIFHLCLHISIICISRNGWEVLAQILLICILCFPHHVE